MQEVTVKVYNYDELNKEVKEIARRNVFPYIEKCKKAAFNEGLRKDLARYGINGTFAYSFQLPLTKYCGINFNTANILTEELKEAILHNGYLNFSPYPYKNHELAKSMFEYLCSIGIPVVHHSKKNFNADVADIQFPESAKIFELFDIEKNIPKAEAEYLRAKAPIELFYTQFCIRAKIEYLQQVLNPESNIEEFIKDALFFADGTVYLH